MYLISFPELERGINMYTGVKSLRQICMTCLQQILFLTQMKCFHFYKSHRFHGPQIKYGLYKTFCIWHQCLLLFFPRTLSKYFIPLFLKDWGFCFECTNEYVFAVFVCIWIYIVRIPGALISTQIDCSVDTWEYWILAFGAHFVVIYCPPNVRMSKSQLDISGQSHYSAYFYETQNLNDLLLAKLEEISSKFTEKD